jgi:redox-sensitive bicupin YhaK (pirin superfamily)
MEILTDMIAGSLGHTDSAGGSGAIVPGELQHMSAGTGIYHSEQNASETETSHSLQIWLEPNRIGVTPQYNQKRFRMAEEPDRMHLLASTDGRDGSFRMAADAELPAATLTADGCLRHAFLKGYGYLHVVRGEASVAAGTLKAGMGWR